ncbi:MAG: hypothetical protein K2Q22_10185, partial [Cytophagales bacterium]|nr:hypothetical protein [Cytophagales bacterium]
IHYDIKGRTEICDSSQIYTYKPTKIIPNSTYTWNIPTSMYIINGATTTSIGIKVKGNFNSSDISLVSTNEIGCKNYSSNLKINRVLNKYNLIAKPFSCADTLITVTLSSPNGINSEIDQFDFCMNYDTSKVQWPQNTPKYTSPPFWGNENVIFEEPTPGNINISIKRNYSLTTLPNILQFNFAPKFQKLNLGDSVKFQSCGIIETFNDGSSQNCYTVSTTSVFSPLKNILEGTLVFSATNRNPIPLTYNSTVTSLFNPTYIRGSTNTICSNLSSPILPNTQGKFYYDLSTGEYLNIERQIPTSTNVLRYINSKDAQKVSGLIYGYVPNQIDFAPTIYDLWAGDVNKDGKISLEDYNQILNISTSGTFNQINGQTKFWFFVDDNYYQYYNNKIGQFIIITPPSSIFDDSKYYYNSKSTLPDIYDCLPIPKKYNFNTNC